MCINPFSIFQIIPRRINPLVKSLYCSTSYECNLLCVYNLDWEGIKFRDTCDVKSVSPADKHHVIS